MHSFKVANGRGAKGPVVQDMVYTMQHIARSSGMREGMVRRGARWLRYYAKGPFQEHRLADQRDQPSSAQKHLCPDCRSAERELRLSSGVSVCKAAAPPSTISHPGGSPGIGSTVLTLHFGLCAQSTCSLFRVFGKRTWWRTVQRAVAWPIADELIYTVRPPQLSFYPVFPR